MLGECLIDDSLVPPCAPTDVVEADVVPAGKVGDLRIPFALEEVKPLRAARTMVGLFHCKGDISADLARCMSGALPL
jgi:hypothetical protein